LNTQSSNIQWNDEVIHDFRSLEWFKNCDLNSDLNLEIEISIDSSESIDKRQSVF